MTDEQPKALWLADMLEKGFRVDGPDWEAAAELRRLHALFNSDLESGLLTFEFPKNMEHPFGRVNLTAAYLLDYWASKDAIPRYDGVIDGLRESAAGIFKVAKPVNFNALREVRYECK